MDLKAYYRKVREAEADTHGRAHRDGQPGDFGRRQRGRRTEVPRLIAARLIAEHRARVANEEEAYEFREAHREAREQYQQEETANRVQVVVIPAREARSKKERS